MARSNRTRSSIPTLHATTPDQIQSSNQQLERVAQQEIDRIVRTAKNVDKVPTLPEAWKSIAKAFRAAALPSHD